MSSFAQYNYNNNLNIYIEQRPHLKRPQGLKRVVLSKQDRLSLNIYIVDNTLFVTGYQQFRNVFSKASSSLHLIPGYAK